MDSLFEADVDYLAVVLAAVAAQPLGFLWYGRFFGTTWTRLRGYADADIQETGYSVYLVTVLTALLMAYVLARLVDMVGANSVGECIAVAAFVWSGFTATVQAGQIAFSPKASERPKLFAIEGGYQLAIMVIAGAIIGAFQ